MIDELEITEKTDELKKLIAQYPELKICVLMGEGAASYDYAWTYANDIKFGVEEILTVSAPYDDEFVCADRDYFEERLEEMLWDEMCDREESYEPSEEELQIALKEEIKKYEPYWEKVIAIYAS